MTVSISIIDDALPQTQCRQCGCDGCLAYATAIIEENMPPNRCAPGGQAGVDKLTQLLGLPKMELDPQYGHEVPFAVARIRTPDCIGCAWCVEACPTAAIIGAPKRLHAVIEERCTGCGLCLTACPMDCIDFENVDLLWDTAHAHQARAMMLETRARRQAQKEALKARLDAMRNPTKTANGKSALMAGILAKVQAQKNQ